MCTSEEMRVGYAQGRTGGSTVTTEVASDFVDQLSYGFVCKAAIGAQALICDKQALCPGNPRNTIVEMIGARH